MFNPLHFLSSLPLLIFSLHLSSLLGSRATIFWDHMTISQSWPPPLPMCSSPHSAASPAQSRPALRMPAPLPCSPWRTASSQTSQVHPGLKVQPGRSNSNTCTWQASLKPVIHYGPTGDSHMSSSPGLSCFSSNMAFLSGLKEPMKASSELLKQYCVLFARPDFHKDPKVTLKTVGWWL